MRLRRHRLGGLERALKHNDSWESSLLHVLVLGSNRNHQWRYLAYLRRHRSNSDIETFSREHRRQGRELQLHLDLPLLFWVQSQLPQFWTID